MADDAIDTYLWLDTYKRGTKVKDIGEGEEDDLTVNVCVAEHASTILFDVHSGITKGPPIVQGENLLPVCPYGDTPCAECIVIQKLGGAPRIIGTEREL